MLWAITSYFNPCNYRRRLQNYRVFRRRLQVPLVTVELSFNGVFQLRTDEADIMIQIRGRDVMWQKERLLNVALKHLPADCDKVAWLDCDVLFQNSAWPAAASLALDHHAIIQPFEQAMEIGNETEGGDPETASEPIAKALATGRLLPSAMLAQDKRAVRVHYGLAWAARREILDRHGLYDACILGTGDGAVSAAVMGNFENLVDFALMNPRRAEHYLKWARAFHRDARGDLGFCTGNAYHLWHGSWEDRRYQDRRTRFAEFDFDPAADLALEESGCWRWNSDKPEMHRFVKDYFARRMEDGPLEGP